MAGNAPLSQEEAERVRKRLLELKEQYPTQSALAEALGVSQQQVSNALRGRNIGFAVVRGVAKLTGRSEAGVLGSADDLFSAHRPVPRVAPHEPNIPPGALPPAPATLADRVDVIMRLFGGDEFTLADRLLMPPARVNRFLADLLRHSNGPADAEVLWALAKLANTNIPFLVSGQGQPGHAMGWIEDRDPAREMPGWAESVGRFLERRPDISRFATELAGEIFLPDPAPFEWTASDALVEALVGVVASLGYPIRVGGIVPMKAPKVDRLFQEEAVRSVYFDAPSEIRQDIGRRLRGLLSVLRLKPADVYRAAGSVELVGSITSAMADPASISPKPVGRHEPWEALHHPMVMEAFASAAGLTSVDVALFVSGLLPRSAVQGRVARLEAMNSGDRSAVLSMQYAILDAVGNGGGMIALRALASVQSFLEESPRSKLTELQSNPGIYPTHEIAPARAEAFLVAVAKGLVDGAVVDYDDAWREAVASPPASLMDQEHGAWTRFRATARV